eukprot:s561_g23.t4
MRGTPITTHVLNTATGTPASGLRVRLKQSCGKEQGELQWKTIQESATGQDGRAGALSEGLTLQAGEIFELHFETMEYFQSQGSPCFYPFVKVVFTIQEPQSHYHVPLLISPFGYSTYRGSPGGQLLEEAVRPFTATMLVPEPKHRGTMKEVVRLPTMQVFASSLKTSAIVVAALLRELQEPAKSKGVEIDSVNLGLHFSTTTWLATSPKRGASSSDPPAASGQVRSSLSKALKQTVQEDSLMLSMTNASDFSDSSSSQRLGHPSGSKEISFQLTATSQLPAVDKRSPTSHLQQTEETAAHRTAQRTAVLAASQDQHALRDVLGDALGGGTAASLGGTARTSAKRTASPGSIPVLNQSTSEVTKALAKRTAQRSAGGLAASQDQHALRDVLGDALGLDSGPSGRRPSRLSETEASTATRMQHSQSTVKEATTLTEEVPGDPGGIFMDQVSPGWKVSSRTCGTRPFWAGILLGKSCCGPAHPMHRVTPFVGLKPFVAAVKGSTSCSKGEPSDGHSNPDAPRHRRCTAAGSVAMCDLRCGRVQTYCQGTRRDHRGGRCHGGACTASAAEVIPTMVVRLAPGVESPLSAMPAEDVVKVFKRFDKDAWQAVELMACCGADETLLLQSAWRPSAAWPEDGNGAITRKELSEVLTALNPEVWDSWSLERLMAPADRTLETG